MLEKFAPKFRGGWLDQADLLRIVSDALESSGITCGFTGSHTSSAYAEIRSTNDIDVVADIRRRAVLDIASIVKISGQSIDLGYIESWAERLGLIEIWSVTLSRVGPGPYGTI